MSSGPAIEKVRGGIFCARADPLVESSPRHAGAAPCVLTYTAYSDWLAAMKRRLRFGPPKHKLPQTSGNRIRPINVPCGVHTVTPLYPTARPALLEHHTLPSTSHRTPSGEHFTPSIM